MDSANYEVGLGFESLGGNGTTFGNEYGIPFVKKFNENLTALVKASQYEGRSSVPGSVGADKTKIWLQLDYGF